MSTSNRYPVSNTENAEKGIPCMTAADEQQLLLRVKNGDQSAFRILVERYMKQAYNIAYGFVNDHDDAEDVAQESFIRVHQSIASFRHESAFGTWLYRIVANLSLNRVRQKKTAMQREVRTDGTVTEMMAVLPHDGSAPDLRHHLERALHELPTLQRAVVILRHFNGMPTRQVSSILNCTEGTVKTHLHRGLKKLRVRVGFLKDHCP
jgi:RNA polymerase sigma-70 factor, ECF subfamily